IFRDFATTGDGQLTAAQLLSIVKRREAKLSFLKTAMERYPQVLVNLQVTPEGKLEFYTNHHVKLALDSATKKMGDSGRIVVRPSGTEPLLRVMVEGQNAEEIQLVAHELIEVMRAELC
ncbi:MAG: phosphoglucosamine mutase, partial [Oscillospiraceae bacterium]